MFPSLSFRSSSFSIPMSICIQLCCPLFIYFNPFSFCPPQIHWEIQSESDLAGDFLSVAGDVVILVGQREALLLLSLMPDTVPEVEELYLVGLTGVEGGATLDGNPNLTSTRIRWVVRLISSNRSPRPRLTFLLIYLFEEFAPVWQVEQILIRFFN